MKRMIALASVLVGIFALAFVLRPAVTVDAQSPDCWYESDKLVQVGVNPFTRQPIYEKEVVYDPDCSRIQDGRVNAEDRAAEAAIYCTRYGVEIYDLNNSGRGDFVFRSTWREIAAIPEKPEENMLIEGVPGFALYRLTSGEMQLNGPADWEGKQYVFIWNGCEAPSTTE